MKTLIATAIITLASTSAYAFDERFDASEYYSGHAGSSLNTAVAAEFNENLYLEGNFIQVDLTPATVPQGDAMTETGSPAALYQEGNFAI